MIAAVVEAECGICNDEEKQLVTSVILNRLEDPRFPSTIEEVLTQKNQFAKGKKASKETLEITRRVIEGRGRNNKVLYFFRTDAPNKNFIKQIKILFKKQYHYYGI